MSKQNTFRKAIQSYLDDRAKNDELFAKSYAKPNKSIDECCAYIIGEAQKQGNAVAMTNDEVFGMAVHYYDEDNIKVNKLPASARATVETKVELTEEEKEIARQVAIRRATEEQYQALKKKPSKAKKEASEVQQMSLF